MKFIFFGTPEVASLTLKSLIEKDYVPSLVVTNPDRPRGRGQTLAPSPVKELALENNLSVITPESLKDQEVLEAMKAIGADFAIVVAYGKILPLNLIEIFPHGVINVHYSLLPKYRGATPLETALQNMDQETGVTLQRMVYELDAGDVIASKTIAINHDDTALSLRPRLISLGSELLLKTLPAYLAGEIELQPQDHSLATRAEKRTKADGELNLEESGLDNWRKYRAFNDTIGTYFFKDGKRFKVTKARFDNDEFIIERVIPEGKSEIEYHP